MDDEIKQLYIEICNYADADKEYGWLDLQFSGRDWRFPKRALMWYVFGEMPPMYDLLPEYEAFSYSGLKMNMDNEYHSDVLVGAGLDLDDTYDMDSIEYEALHQAQKLIEEEFYKLREFDFTILAASHPRKQFRCEVYEYEPKSPNVSSNAHIDDAEPPDDWGRLRVLTTYKYNESHWAESKCRRSSFDSAQDDNISE